jgi:uncharacterized protein
MGTALITGASSGLGMDFAQLFAKDGHSLILVARRKELLEKVSQEALILNPKINVTIIAFDLATPGSGHELYKKVSSLGLKVDFLVNNAGFGTNGTYKDLPLNKELEMVDLNIRTLIELTHLFLPAMVKNKFGHILNVGSTAGFQCGPYMATYYASKAFVNSWSEALSEELIDTGVNCTLLAPGATGTEFAKAADMEKSKLFTLNKPAKSYDVALYGYQAMWKKTPVAIFGLMNRIMVRLVGVIPRGLLRKVVTFLNRQ